MFLRLTLSQVFDSRLWSLHVLLLPVRLLSAGYSGFLPQSKDVQLGWTGDSRLSAGVTASTNASLSLCSLVSNVDLNKTFSITFEMSETQLQILQLCFSSRIKSSSYKQCSGCSTFWQVYFHCQNGIGCHWTVRICAEVSSLDTSVWELFIILSVISATASGSSSPSFLLEGLHIQLHF